VKSTLARAFCARWLLTWLCWSADAYLASAADNWLEPLAQMPLGGTVRELNRTNCVEVMLGAFRSNGVVKALIFMPGATDEFYMFRRAKAELTNVSPTLLDAIGALTNQTQIRIAFKPPLLLLHTDEDPLMPEMRVEDSPNRDKMMHALLKGHTLFIDRDWDVVQPIFRRALHVDVRPWQHSRDSWHFYRHSFAGWNLSGWEALECAALAGKSRCRIRHKQVVFEPDPRACSSVRFETPRSAPENR
jgi:hypothetical protein